ncbi:MAG TPA: hypothetical protein VFP91_01560 [Vicinamibacterales bacterium]|nr:hypothetical protein [Vicinamibacterales bacterium]
MRRTGLLLSIAIVGSLSHHVIGRATAARPEDTTDTRISDKDAAVLVQRFEQWATAELRKMDPVGELYLQPDRGDKASDSYSWGRVVTSSAGDLPNGVDELLSPDPRFDANRYVLRFLRHDLVNGTPVSVYEVHPRGRYDGFEGQVALDREGMVWQYVGSRHAVDSLLTRWSGQWRRRRYVYSGWRARLHGGSVYTTDVFIQQIPSADSPSDFSRRGRMRLWNYGKSREEQARAELQVVQGVERSRGRTLGPSADESERRWMREAENYVLDVLTREGYLAPEGTFETSVCSQVISNLLAIARLSEPIDPPVRCRVLLSSRLDLRLLGHTMLISVGVLDTAGDEATVATILAHGLAEIVIKPTPITAKVAFVKRPALELLAALETKATDEEPVNKYALALLSKSLYAPKLQQAGLFLDGINDVSPRLQTLVPPTFVDHVGDTAGVLRQSEWMRRRPVYDPQRDGHFSALPLGSRMAVNRETNRVDLLRAPIVPMKGKSFGVVPPYPSNADEVGASIASRATSD